MDNYKQIDAGVPEAIHLSNTISTLPTIYSALSDRLEASSALANTSF